MAFRPIGTEGSDDLARQAVRSEVFRTEILVASPPGLIRSEEAAGRSEDRSDGSLLRETLMRIS